MIENQLEIDYHIYKTYQVLGLVGKGTYGQVYKAKHKKSQQIFAIKKICDAFQNVTDAKRTYRQLHYLFQLSHPCIVKLYQDLALQANQAHPEHNFSLAVHKVVMVTVHKSRVKFKKRVENMYMLCFNTQKQIYARLYVCVHYKEFNIFHGILYLHRSKLIHRDIKPSNILIDSNCDIKICDFGLTRLQYQHKQQQQTNIITQYVASRWYRPPEILLGFNRCDYSIDIWGMGCLMAELILRQPLFQGNTTMDQLQKIFRLIGLPKEDQITKLQTEHAKFILRNFTFSRKNKPQKINQVFGQASDEQIDLIQKLLKFNPEDRLTAEEALNHPYFTEMKQMNYNFQQYNVPVKIIDHSEPSTFLSDLKHFGQEDKLKKSVQKHKRKQISLQQYQNLIQQLQRATSRSSNRIYPQRIYKQSDKIIQRPIQKPQFSQNGIKSSQNGLKSYQHNDLKQKSIRQSNFPFDQKSINSLHQHKLKQIKEEKQQNDNVPTKIVDYLRGNRNALSTVDYYQHKHNQKGFTSNQQIFVKQPKQNSIGHFVSHFVSQNFVSQNFISQNVNQNMENNLQKQYSQSFNPFDKQTNKIQQHKDTNKNSTQKLVSNKVKKVSKQGSIAQNRSKTKISSDAKKQKQKSFIKSKPDPTKNKHASYSSLNQANKTKQKIVKKSKDQSSKQIKQASKSKHSSGSGHINKITNKNNEKSTQHIKYDSSLNKNKQKKKIKQTFKAQPQQYKEEQYKKEVLINRNYQNCFSTIQIDNVQAKNTSSHLFQVNKQRAMFNQSLPYALNDNKKSTNQLKKLTNQKKSRQALLKGANSKSIGKKKSMTKIQNANAK